MEHIIYRDELEQLRVEGCHIVHTLTRNDDPFWHGYSKRIDASLLAEFVQDFEGKQYYVCGPPPFCDCVVALLMQAGVARNGIKVEKYD